MSKIISSILKKEWGVENSVQQQKSKTDAKTKAYFDKLNNPQPPKPKKQLTEKQLKQQFNHVANKITGGFTYTDENKPVIQALFYYFTNNPQFNNSQIVSNQPSLNKGILLIGNTGSGKTTILDIFKALKWQGFRKFSAYDYVSSFEQGGEKEIQTYFTGSIFFDEIGAEHEAYYYGKREEVGTRILEKRYTLYKTDNKKTHGTTNLSLEQLTQKYGFRLEGRILEMFNIIYLGKKANSIDFRIKNHK